MKSILLIGQSNMAGRGFLHDVPPIINERIQMLRNGRWQMMAEPINVDRHIAGIGPAASFAEAWTNDHPNESIGIIPCAEGGSSIDEWTIDGVLTRHAIQQAQFALESSDLIAILWHQGESDSFNQRYQTYEKKLQRLFQYLRTELALPQLPILIGELGSFLGQKGFGKSAIEYEYINQILYRFATRELNCYFVTAKNLSSNPDGIHINAVSQRKFGIRYYEAFSKQKHLLEPLEKEAHWIDQQASRLLTQTEQIFVESTRLAVGESTYEIFDQNINCILADKNN